MASELTPLVLLHTAISLVAIFTGFVVLFAGFLAGRPLPRWTASFLVTTLLTSVSGFFLPATHFMPSHGVGILSITVLTLALVALYSRHLRGAWRRVYVITAVAALYLNVFVLVAQLFSKVPSLKVLAPTQSEPPFQVTEGLVLLAFVVLGALAVARYRPTPAAAGTNP